MLKKKKFIPLFRKSSAFLAYGYYAAKAKSLIKLDEVVPIFRSKIIGYSFRKLAYFNYPEKVIFWKKFKQHYLYFKKFRKLNRFFFISVLIHLCSILFFNGEKKRYRFKINKMYTVLCSFYNNFFFFKLSIILVFISKNNNLLNLNKKLRNLFYNFFFFQQYKKLNFYFIRRQLATVPFFLKKSHSLYLKNKLKLNLFFNKLLINNLLINKNKVINTFLEVKCLFYFNYFLKNQNNYIKGKKAITGDKARALKYLIHFKK